MVRWSLYFIVYSIICVLLTFKYNQTDRLFPEGFLALVFLLAMAFCLSRVIKLVIAKRKEIKPMMVLILVEIENNGSWFPQCIVAMDDVLDSWIRREEKHYGTVARVDRRSRSIEIDVREGKSDKLMKTFKYRYNFVTYYGDVHLNTGVRVPEDERIR